MTENTLWLDLDARRARGQGPDAIARRQRERLARTVAHARSASPYYRELYRHLPEHVATTRALPVTGKQELTEHFDDWATDREITADKVRAFTDDPDRIGRRFLGRYLVATTSGTSGRRGVFVLDDRCLHVGSAVLSAALTSWLGPRDLARAALRRGRFAQLVATEGHYVGYASYSRTRREGGLRGKLVRAFSVHEPTERLAAELDAYRPAFVIGAAGTIMLLAAEQEAGRLHLDPVLVQPAGETLSTADTDRIARAFHAPVHMAYSATECIYLSYTCADGWYHLNADWAVLEPVDADHRPTPPGEFSHTVLLTNLANRVQPVIRYDLGDSVMLRPDPCPCGSPLPALRVRGRSGDILTFPTGRGADVRLSPLALSSLFDRVPGIELFQVEQTAPTTLRVRLETAPGADADTVWRTSRDELTRLLADNRLDDVTVERADEPPHQTPGGKYRTVVPLD
ncbi:phenylacetate--CoA ligase family protein [Streptomyces acidiscabies]|uniref:Phenylacetate--CoA ligase family protein n=2 Tax=Streptomyces acidiscabies TaxID=42234 RepID=A0AAP6BEN3_9ACTN|nr:phenylacetate--CoA ligase family protein [Streptomyces acidiscabies]MBP5941847.1 phenylacetate--CoA ligase family protein [Streptomyces sp. LBUM 1476]MBZ3913280.1 phenylacetate--CoA ligase family protein [Streptomyces acidiscabies]MDX2963294.1 phenylacetate--CoA ligase family protein [Streptomyces acidiscabies]MDX3021488.1 phenylacetate--CoA ligase family protein [Streptomyces acidiscabies]MDX3790247.1 phenylacetate--CoA ligase family protein [Streptomyces acidiscabies]